MSVGGTLLDEDSAPFYRQILCISHFEISIALVIPTGLNQISTDVCSVGRSKTRNQNRVRSSFVPIIIKFGT